MRNFNGRLARLERQRTARFGRYHVIIRWDETPGVMTGPGGQVIEPEDVPDDVKTIVLSWGDSDERTYE